MHIVTVFPLVMIESFEGEQGRCWPELFALPDDILKDFTLALVLVTHHRSFKTAVPGPGCHGAVNRCLPLMWNLRITKQRGLSERAF